MGVGGLKGHNLQSSNGGGRTGKSYCWMLLCFLAFGASIFGVMTFHKLKERRIFNLVIKDKDLQLHSLHLHLQKERESVKEVKRKSEEMRSKLYSLQNQKMELSSRIMEMQSTISSLKEEHKTIESALEEKQNEINLMKENGKHVNHQGRSFLTALLSQREAEIEHQKHNLKLPVRDQPMNSDDLASPMTRNTMIGAGAGENARKEEHMRERGNVANKDVSGEVQHQGFPHENTNDRNHSQRRSTGVSQQRNANATEEIVNSVAKFQKPEDTDGAALATNSSAENNSKPENKGVRSVKGRRFFINTIESEQKRLPKGEMQNLFNNEGQNLASDIRTASTKKDVKLNSYNESQPGMQVKVENRHEKAISKGKIQKGKDNKSEEISKKSFSSKIKLIKTKKSEYDTRILNSHKDSAVGITERLSESAHQVKVKRNINGRGVPLGGRKQKPKDIFQPQEHANAYTHHIDSSSSNIAENHGQTNPADKKDSIADWEIEDIHNLDMRNALHLAHDRTKTE